jgi:hypothetical protein
MADLISGLRQVIQDLVAPDLKAIQAKQDAMAQRMELQYDSLRRQMEVEHNAVMTNMDAFRAEMRSEFAALRATNQLEVYRQISPLSERISVVEKRV